MEISEYVLIGLKIIVGISILNVWLIQPKKETIWRGGNAKNIVEEFKVYGLSKTTCYIIGFLKVTLAILLLLSIQFKFLTIYASLGLAFLLFGSIIMHIKVKDAWFKSIPAFLFFSMNLVIAYLG
ncbi:DoxX family protein [Polaribacter sp.]|nr:DoxX family protein [Polaribacter sp.]